MAVVRNSGGEPGGMGGVSMHASIASALALWAGEAFVGLTPLMAHVVIHRFMAVPGHFARCQEEVRGQFVGCHWVADRPDAEICILAVVLSGLVLLPVLHSRVVAGREWRQFFRHVMVVWVGSVMVLSSMLFVLVSAGINRDTGEVVWLGLACALLGSLILALERATERGK